MREYKNLSWVRGMDRKIRPEGHCLASRGLMDSFSCIPFISERVFNNAVTSIEDVGHIVIILRDV